MFVVALMTICGAALFTACSSDIVDNPVNPPTDLSDQIDEFKDVPGNAGDPAVVAALQSIENVEDLKPFFNVKLGQAYSSQQSLAGHLQAAGGADLCQ